MLLLRSFDKKDANKGQIRRDFHLSRVNHHLSTRILKYAGKRFF